jgi:FkbM family methyltransferase
MKKFFEFIGCALTLGVSPADKWQIFWRQTKNFRVRLGLGKYRPQDVYTLNTHFGRLTFRDNFGDITNLTNLLYRQVYRWKELSHSGPILDVGANIGMASVWFRHFNPDLRVICFEPLPENVAMIAKNCPQAEIVNAAVGCEVGSMSLSTDTDGVMASRVPNPHASLTKNFPVITLNGFAREKDIRQFSLLKIDAEGTEVEILQGGSSLLGNKGQVVIETHGIERHNTCLELLQQYGYRIENQQFSAETGMVFAVASDEKV